MDLIWSSESYAIYNDKRNGEHVLYKSGECIFSANTFDEVYEHSMKVRGLKV